MTDHQRNNRRRFIEGAVCAALEVRPDIVSFFWNGRHLYVSGATSLFWTFTQLDRLARAMYAIGLDLEGGQIIAYPDLSLNIIFLDPFKQIEQ